MAISVTFPSAGAGKAFEGDGLKVKPVMVNLGTYATNGIAIAASDCKMEILVDLFFCSVYTTNIKALRYDKANGKIIAYSDQDATEVSNSTDLSAQPFMALAVGR